MLLRNKTGLTGLLILLLVTVLVIRFYASTLNEFPSHTHAWSQADRYALAIGFTKNGGNLFLPQTYNLNPQFPAEKEVEDPQGITAVDFPLPDYLVSLFMRITGSTAPWTFRLLTLLAGLGGLFFLFRLTILFTGSRKAAVFMVLFLFLSPVYAYYQYGFIPSVYSLALLLASWFFYFRYLKDDLLKDLIMAVILLTLAALIRTSFAVFLIAIAAQRFLALLSGKKKILPEILIFVSCFLVLGTYFLYNQHLREVYGSVFLSKPIPPSSLSNLTDDVNTAWQSWKLKYFTRWHYWLMFLLLILALISIVLKKKRIKGRNLSILVYTVIAAFGTVLYSVLLSRQFRQHDYYFIDTFLPVALLAVLLLVKAVPKGKGLLQLSPWIAAFVLLLLSAYDCDHFLQQRRSTGWWDRVQLTINNYEGSADWLDSMGVARDARILVPGTPSPNIPFILMDRKGYALMTTSETHFLDALANFGFDYAVGQDYYFQEDVTGPFPAFTGYFTRIAGNGKVSLYAKVDRRPETDISKFLSNVMDTTCKVSGRRDSSLFYRTLYLDGDRYLSLLETRDTTGNDFFNSIEVEGNWTSKQPEGKIKLVCSRLKNNEMIFYKEYLLGDLDSLSQFRHNLFLLSNVSGPGTVTKIYLDNRAGLQVTADSVYINTFTR